MVVICRSALIAVTALSTAAILLIIFAWAGPGLEGLSGPASAEALFNEDKVQAIYRQVSPAVVEVNVDRWVDDSYVQVGFGSGFLIDGEGHIATNYHVVKEGDRIRVGFLDGPKAVATLLGYSPAHDLALLKVSPEIVKNIEPVPLGDSFLANPGQLALTIGSPFQLEGSLSVGVISGVDRALPNDLGRNISGVLQTDALIGPGNSGGPLLNGAGQAVGINTAIEISSTWVGRRSAGFAVPINALIDLLPELIAGQVVRPAWLGIGIADVDESLAADLDLPVAQGAYVTSVMDNSPAQRAEIIPAYIDEGGNMSSLGDVIVAVDGQSVASSEQLVALLDGYDVGEQVVLTVLRGGQEHRLDITLAAWPASALEIANTTISPRPDRGPGIPRNNGSPTDTEAALPELMP